MITRREANRRPGGQANVALIRPKTETNVGTAMRSCQIFGVKSIQVVGARYQRQNSNVLHTERHVPLFVNDELAIPFDCVPVAVEITDDAEPLETYHHPRSAIYIFGPEDGSVPGEVMERCRDVVRIPGEYCLNLAAAVSIVLYDREAKREVMP